MNEVNQDFSRVARIVDENGLAVISNDNKPRYIVLDFAEYNEIQAVRLRRKLFVDASDSLIAENIEALKALAK